MKSLVFKLEISPKKYNLFIKVDSNKKITCWLSDFINIPREPYYLDDFNNLIADPGLVAYLEEDMRWESKVRQDVTRYLIRNSITGYLVFDTTLNYHGTSISLDKDLVYLFFYRFLNFDDYLGFSVLSPEELQDDTGFIPKRNPKNGTEISKYNADDVCQLILEYFKLQARMRFYIELDTDMEFADCALLGAEDIYSPDIVWSFLDHVALLILDVFKGVGSKYILDGGREYLDYSYSKYGPTLIVLYQPKSIAQMVRDSSIVAEKLDTWLEEYEPLGVTCLVDLREYFKDARFYVNE